MDCDVLKFARGSTYDFTTTLDEDYDLSSAEAIWITFKQSRYGKEVLTLELPDLIIVDNEIHARLTQEQTLKFMPTNEARMQFRGLINGESIVQELFTPVIVLPVEKDGVIS